MSFNLLQALRVHNAPVRASKLAERHGVSYPTMWRAAKAAGPQVAQWKQGRERILALAREPFRVPVRAVRPDGGVDELESLLPLLAGTRWIDWRGRPRLFAGLPPELNDARPQGFLGRAFAHRCAPRYGVARNPDAWSDDQVLQVLSETGDDLPGNLIIGEAAFQRFLRMDLDAVAVDEADLALALPRLAERAIAGEVPGSSPGGEQPKATAVVRRADGGLRHVMVKFSPVVTAPGDAAGTRWADLLACEAIALEVLADEGFAVARSRLLDSEGRRFLIAERFDRQGAVGRRSLVSLGAIDDEYFGQRATTWVGAAHRLQHAAMIGAEDALRLATLYAFGVLIANSDMHYGNIGLQQGSGESGEPALRLAPVYDMLPMLYAPQRTEVRAVEFQPQPASIIGLGAGSARQALAMAQRYWARCADEPTLSVPFRGIAAANHRAICLTQWTSLGLPRSGISRCSVFEAGQPFRHVRSHRLGQVLALQHGGVPGGDVIQAVRHAVVAGVGQHLLGAANRQRRLGGNRGGNVLHPGVKLFAAVEHAVHETQGLRFRCAELAPRVGQFAHRTCSDELGQALQRAHVGHHADVDLLDGEARIA